MSCILYILLFLSATGQDAAIDREMFTAYREMNYSKALSLAEKLPHSGEAKLIKAFCLIEKKKNRDIESAFDILDSLVKDKTLPKEIYIESQILLSRTAQLMQRRNGVYPAAGKVNWKKSYNAILEKFPDSAYACRTIVYLLEDDFSQSDPEISAGAFDKLESFIKKFAGDSRNLVPVHLFADFEYIARRVDYKSAIRHLKAAYDLGIISPKVAEETLFRLGRMSQIKLKNSQSAEKYYTIFLEKFPHSRYTPLVKRYLSEL